MKTDPDLWRTLVVGDRIRIVHLPCEYSEQEYALHPETEAFYRYMILSGDLMMIHRLDNDAFPWAECTVINQEGCEVYQYLLINHDGVELVS